MIFLVMFLAAVISSVIYGGGMYALSKKDKDSTRIITSPTAGLSRVSKQLYKEYMKLPQDSRPFPDILGILKALDAKTNPWAVDRDRRHFNQQWLPYVEAYHGFEFRWLARGAKGCMHRNCEFSDYYRLHESIKQVADALAEREQTMLESSLAGDLDMLAELQSRLRDEAGIQKSITREFKAL